MINRLFSGAQNVLSVTDGEKSGSLSWNSFLGILTLLVLILLSYLPGPVHAAPVDGDLEIHLPLLATETGVTEFRGGIIELRGNNNDFYRASLNPPGSTGYTGAIFWGLPAGSYQWRLLQPGVETGWNSQRIDIAPGTRTRYLLRGQKEPIIHILNPTAALIGLDAAAGKLPGVGTDPLEQLSTFPDYRAVSSWERLELNNPSRREPLSVNIPMALSQTSRGLSSLTAPWDPDGWRAARHGREDNRTGLFGTGRADSYKRLDGTGRVYWKPRKPFQGTMEIVGRYRVDEDPFPRKTADNPRSHSKLLEQEIYGNLELNGGRGLLRSWKLTSSFAGSGKEQDYLLKSFEKNQDHSPREKSAFTAWNAGLEKELSYTNNLADDGTRGPWRHRFRIQMDYSRNFREIGDGVYFDQLDLYGRLDGNSATVDDGTSWSGDNPATHFVNDGHVYENYRLHVTNSWSAQASWEMMIRQQSRLRAEAAMTRNNVRYYEHFSPTQTYAGVEGGGYLSVQRFGYTIDGTERDDSGRLDVPEFQTGLLWERIGSKGLLQASIYGRWYRSDHLGPKDWSNLPDLDSSPEAFKALLGKPGFTGGIGGSIGQSILMGSTTVWFRGQETVNRPPLLALGLDPVFFQRSVFRSLNSRQTEAPLGNPHLDPEGETQLQIGARFPGPHSLLIQVSLYGSWTRDAWVEKETSEETGFPLVYIDNSGKQRTRGIHIDTKSSHTLPEEGFWIYASYDLSRMEFKGGGPLSLDAGWREPDLPLGTPLVRETTDTFGTPVSAWTGADYKPQTLDRTHRFRLAAIYKTPKKSGSPWLAPFTDWALGLSTRWESGRPYTPVAVNAEALAGPAEISAYGDPHSGRLPNTFRVDLSATKEWHFQHRELTIRFEVLNVMGRRNALRVYRATGEADNDGFLQSPDGQEMIEQYGEGFISTYQNALEDPFNFDIPTTFRISVNLSLSRIPVMVSS